MSQLLDVSELSPDCVKIALSAAVVEPDEVRALYAQFLEIKGPEAAEDALLNQECVCSAKRDALIHSAYREFQRALGFKRETSLFVERVFTLFDQNGDGLISFTEFIKGLAILSPNGTLEQKLKCTSNDPHWHRDLPNQVCSHVQHLRFQRRRQNLKG